MILLNGPSFRKKHSTAKVYEQLLDDPTVYAVYIAVRHADHYRFAASALNNKKAVLCEKPATLNTAETRKLCSLSEKTRYFLWKH